MNTTNFTLFQSYFRYLILGTVLSSGMLVFGQNTTAQDSTKTGVAMGKVTMPNPNSIVSKYTYDPILNRYIYTEKVGKFNINYPIILTPAEFQKLVLQEKMKEYYKEKIDAAAGLKDDSQDAQKNLLPEFYINSGLFETIFGGNTIEVIPQGSVEVDFGVLFTKQDNPNFSPQNRRNFTFDFDQRISLSLLGKVGTRLQVTANYDTESTFDFQNLIKLEYTPTEDDIVRKIEVGNVNMPLNSSLIQGAQALFGVKTELQFGKTTVTAVFSEQKSQTQSVTAQGGGTLEEFEFFGRDYDENRHYFLAQYFRNTYDRAMLRYPYIDNNVQITRIEVWVTNRNNQTDNVRNVVAFQDLGESEIVGSAVPILQPNGLPDNQNNGFDPENIGGAGSVLTEAVRTITNVEAGITLPVNEGFDYGKVESARKLNEGQDYILNTQLGYISLNQRLLNDEVLAVAFQYTVNGEVFQVGEFANDGVNATDVQDGNNGNQVINNNAIVLKMLKSAVTAVDQPIWDLMMKNIYDTGAFQLDREDFRLNIFYREASPLNYIVPVEGTTFPIFNNNTTTTADDTEIEQTPLIRLFHWDRLNFNNDPQELGDGFFDFVDFQGRTVIAQNGKLVFTKVEPFGEYLFEVLRTDPSENYESVTTYNPNQEKYVYDVLYRSTKTAALDEAEKNKFQIKGRYKSSGGGGGIPLGAFNVPRGSVRVTAGGRTLVEGVDYTVNYQTGRVQILDPSLEASNTPINVSVENNAVFGQQTRRFMGVNVEHKFNDDFVLGATFLNLNERPITQKANYNAESINNTIFGVNGNFSSELPFLTRWANKLPNIDTDVPSNISVRGEFAYLLPGAPNGTDLNNEATAYIDDFEGTQGAIDLLAPQSWFLSSRPMELPANVPGDDQIGIQNGYGRALLNWYSVDPIFYGSQRPGGVTDDEVSDLRTRRIFINEIFPQINIVQGQTTVTPTLDLAYYPAERGPYNFDSDASDGVLNPQNSWAGITRQITSTDFEQANVEYIEFWMQDPFLDDPTNPGGKLTFNLGNISEDVLKDGKKQYENGLPEDGDIGFLQNVSNQNPYVVPQSQSLIYTFGTTGQERTNQDVGYDGYDNVEEAGMVSQLGLAGFNVEDPSNDDYLYYLQAEGGILERYKKYNGVDGNTPDTFTDTDRGNTTQPDAEDINRDNTMNTIDGYFEYIMDIRPNTLNINNEFINDVKTTSVTLPNGTTRDDIRWYQFRIPVNVPLERFDSNAADDQAYNRIGGITDFRSVRFARMYLSEFTQSTVMRFATLELVRSDWRRYGLDLDNDPNNNSGDDLDFSVGVVSVEDNDQFYVEPPGIVREQLNNNNTIIQENEQSLVVQACNLAATDAVGVYKNINIDMRQYKKLRMFLHAEPQENRTLSSNEMVGFIRMGNDFTDNFYQIEIPLIVQDGRSPEAVWPNEIDMPLSVLEKIKSIGISDQTLANADPTFYDVINGELNEQSVDPDSNYNQEGLQRVGIKGNPNFGDIRVLMVGVKNGRNDGADVCGEVWFNELRISDLDNEGGWAAVVSMDSNIADFANISATGRRSTTGFGSLEQRPNERSREDIKQYDVVTNINLGQLLPKKWGLQIPFNYAQSEELITPEYDQFYRDITLESRLDAADSAEERETIRNQSEDYTKRQSINFIGVRKERTTDKTPRFYDIENFTFNYAYNKVEHRDFEIESSLDQNVRAGVNYAFNFEPKTIEPFKKNDSLFTGKYWQILKDFNFNYLPNSFTINSDILRQFSKQKFREIELAGDNIGIEELFRRNYNFDFQYAINYQLTKSLTLNFTASNSNIVRNYFIDDRLNGRQDPTLNVWDGFFDLGDPNIQSQQLQINYELPLYKLPFLSFLRADYSYTGDFQWQKGSDLNRNFEGTFTNAGGEIETGIFDLGNSIQNANSHVINSTLSMESLYRYLGLTKSNSNRSRANRPQTKTGGTPPTGNTTKPASKNSVGKKLGNTAVDLLTMVKRIQVNYQETNGTYLPGYTETPGFIGTFRPTFGYTFGGQRDIRQLSARNGWLTLYPEFNQQYTEVTNRNLDYTVNVEPIRDLKIDLIGNRIFSENLSESFRVDTDINGLRNYVGLNPNAFGNFSISTNLIRTAFGKSDETGSAAFDTFRENRLTIANRLARSRGIDLTDPTNLDAEGFPIGYGKNSQQVLLPAFLSAYTGSKPDNISLGAFRDFPIPNWNLKYTGLMKLKWFKKRFKRFSINHGYRSNYTINQFRTNLEFNPDNPDELNQGGNFKNATLFSNINLEEQFSPLIRLDMEMKNSMRVLAEVKTDRILSLSFDNNLLTEIQGKEYTLGLGYRIKDLRIRSKLAGPRQVIKSDLNMKADISVRDNKTIIRYLDAETNQITAGQTIWGVNYTAEYAFTKNLTGIFYFDYAFSDYAISTSFPQTSIRSGLTLRYNFGN